MYLTSGRARSLRAVQEGGDACRVWADDYDGKNPLIYGMDEGLRVGGVCCTIIWYPMAREKRDVQTADYA